MEIVHAGYDGVNIEIWAEMSDDEQWTEYEYQCDTVNELQEEIDRLREL